MSDSDVLLAYMCEREVDEDGNLGAPKFLSGDVFTRNLKSAAAEIGWLPDHLHGVLQELVADGKVEPAHDDGDPTRFANTQWRVLGYEPPAEAADDDLDEMTVPKLRAFAEENGIDLGDAAKKPEIRAKIDAWLESDPNGGDA